MAPRRYRSVSDPSCSIVSSSFATDGQCGFSSCLSAHCRLTHLLHHHFRVNTSLLLSTLRQDFVLLTHSGASPPRQKPQHVENRHPRDLLNFNRESLATSWLAASKSCCSSNSVTRTGLYADVTLNCCSSLFM